MDANRLTNPEQIIYDNKKIIKTKAGNVCALPAFKITPAGNQQISKAGCSDIILKSQNDCKL